MEYEVFILNDLIDRFERRDPAKPKPQKISFDVGRKLHAYRETLSPEQHRIEEAIQHLVSWSFVTSTQDLRGYYTKLILNENAIPRIYQHLNRVPKADQHQAQRKLLEQTISHSSNITNRFCSAMLERLDLRKDIEYGLSKDFRLLEDVLLALEHIERLNEETYIRNFSEMVFHDSKRFQSIQNTVIKILMDYGDGLYSKESILAQHNLISNPGYVHIKGDWQIWCRGYMLSADMFHGGIAISSDALDDIERIVVPGGTVISVENLTTYHDTKEHQGAVLYLGGFLNTVRTNFLKKLYRFEPNARYFHKGDLDPYGFLILENLKEKTGIPFLPLEMDLETLRRCHRTGHFKPLDEQDRKAMESTKLAVYRPILEYMLELNCKAEQECFEAMKLESLVCT